MRYQKTLRGDCLPWLLPADEPGARYLALRDVVRLERDDPELLEAKEAAHRSGPIARIVSAMHDEADWVKPGAGYSPKYRGTVWSLIALAQLGASLEMDSRIARATEHLLAHALTDKGQFSFLLAALRSAQTASEEQAR